MLQHLSSLAEKCSNIDPELYAKYDVKRGLRDISGKGVLAGLTEIGEVHSYIIYDNELVHIPGELYYRGISIVDLANGFIGDRRTGFEETCYLLLFGELPNKKSLEDFKDLLSDYRTLPKSFVRDMIMKAPSKDIMNVLSRTVLALYSYDENPDDTSIENILRQCLQMISRFPLLAVYGYQAYNHYHGKNSLIIHSPRADYSVAENILHMLRPDSEFTELEAALLDLILVVHAEHGGGNNSSFTTRVVTSSGTDTYSVMSAALGSLKGPRHGGANIKVVQMFEDMKQNVSNWDDEAEIENYLRKLLGKEAFDRSGLIYGIGHPVYSTSDPRTIMLREQCAKLAQNKGLEDEFKLYTKVERLAPEIIADVRKMYKGVTANVDFYTGFIYKMLDIPLELNTPLFAISRIAGWSAHRIEEIISKGRIIRPAYKSIAPRSAYVPMDKR